MLRYVIKKIAYGFTVLVAVVALVFLLIQGLGDPARLTQGQRTDIATMEAVRKDLGLDLPLGVRLLHYLNDVSPISIYQDTPENKSEYRYSKILPLGDRALVFKTPYLGRSYQSKKRVTEILREALPQTIILGLSAIIFATIFGILLGVWAAMRQFSFTDSSILVGSILGISQPSYFSGMILALVFGYWLRDYTGLNYTGDLFSTDMYGDPITQWKNLILPTIALGIRPLAIIVQLTRSTMLETLSQDYIRTAKAKGVSNRIVVLKHALRNALNPVVTAISGWLAAILAGAYFIEIVFDFKGLGYETINALNNLDLPVAMGSILFAAVLFVSINILVDVLYGWLDPRVSYD